MNNGCPQYSTNIPDPNEARVWMTGFMHSDLSGPLSVQTSSPDAGSGLYFDRSGAPLNVLQWAALFENWTYRCIEVTYLGKEWPAGMWPKSWPKRKWRCSVRISTVWLGLNHNFGSGTPLIFETMIFGGALDGSEIRYGTIQEARIGHQEMVRRAEAANRWWPRLCCMIRRIWRKEEA